MRLLLDKVRLLSSGDGSRDGLLLHAVKKHMYRFGNRAVRRVWKYQNAGLDSRIVKGA